MDEAAVAQAIETIEAQGKEPSTGNIRKVLGHGSLREITKHRKKLLPHLGRAPHMDVTRTVDALAAPAAVLDPAMVPAEAAAPEAGPSTLLAQAEAALQAALVEERRARRDYDLTTDAQERVRCQQEWAAARKEREHAATRLEQLTRSRDARLAALPSLRSAARQAAGELAAVQEQTRRTLLKAERQAEMAQQELDQVLQQLTDLAGAAAITAEDGG